MSSLPSSTFSFSAQCFSKEDFERELNELTEAEKETILDDKYGRRRQNTDTNNDADNDDDISHELLNDFYRTRETLPPETAEDLWMAFFDNDLVVEVESAPELFLRCENYDPERAASRQGEYWKMRYEIFGEVDAVKPLTLNGAMKSVVPYMVQIPNFFRILPDDDHGRTVICFDRTDMRFKDYDDVVLIKIMWFVFQKALEKLQTQRNGVVLIIISQLQGWDAPSINFLKMAAKSISYCLPIKIRCRHACLSSLFATLISPIVNNLVSRDVRLRSQIHNCLKQPHMLNQLKDFGLQRNNLPKSIGGKYDEKPSWIYECERILKMNRKRCRDKRDGGE